MDQSPIGRFSAYLAPVVHDYNMARLPGGGASFGGSEGWRWLSDSLPEDDLSLLAVGECHQLEEGYIGGIRPPADVAFLAILWINSAQTTFRCRLQSARVKWQT